MSGLIKNARMTYMTGDMLKYLAIFKDFVGINVGLVRRTLPAMH